MAKFVHSFSATKKYRQCPQLFYQDRVLRKFPFVQGPEAAEGDRKHKLMANAINRRAAITGDEEWYMTLVDKLRAYGGLLKAEVRLAVTARGESCEYFADEAYYRAILDVMQIDEDGRMARIYDWKFGKDKFPDTDQLVENAVCLFAGFPEVERVETRLVWPETGKIEHLTFDRKYFADYFADLIAQLSEIDASMRNNTFPLAKGPLCPWCPITDCPNWTPPKKK